MKHYIFIFILIYLVSACRNDHSEPKKVYMPDMYYSEAYEPYANPPIDYINNSNKKFLFNIIGRVSLDPVLGTVSRNKNNLLPYTIPNNNEGYETSKKIINSPLNQINKKEIDNNFKMGKKIYEINCTICHGENGDGQGYLVKNEKILGVPNYKDRDITIGSIYHVIMYGKNNMGIYSSQLNVIDRWKVAEYVMYLKNQKFQ